MCGALLGALFLIGVGLLALFNKDLMWEFTSWQNRSRGIPVSERTPEWEFQTTLGGVMILIFGGIVLLIVLFG
jgi:hypothetical protein